MNPAQELLAQLRDIHLPADPSWWPPAPGWWLLGLCLVVLIYLVLGKLLKWYRIAAPSRKFVNALRSLPISDPAKSQQNLRSMSRLARQYAITRYGRGRTAGLTGTSWLNFLDQSSASSAFSEGPGKILAEGPYCRPVSHDLEQVRVALEMWARKTARKSTLNNHR